MKFISNGKFECPSCKKHFASILNHINGGKCKITNTEIDQKEFRNQHDGFKEGFMLEMGRNRKRKSRTKLIQEKDLQK